MAARGSPLGEEAGVAAATAAAASYREGIRDFAGPTVLDTWYARMDEKTAEVLARGRSAAALDDLFATARTKTSATALPALAELSDAGTWRIVDHPPVVTHEGIDQHEAGLRRLIDTYRHSLSDDRRLLLDHFELRDLALKVAGVGSVGTRCFVALLASDRDEPLFLQVKEAQASVLAAVRRRRLRPRSRPARRRRTAHHAAGSDVFLGWASADGFDFYVRQLRDMKGSADFATMDATVLRDYLRLCGWSLARAHARLPDAAAIAGYLGAGDRFDRALADFAVAYADQTERDHQELVDAVKAGRIRAAS